MPAFANARRVLAAPDPAKPQIVANHGEMIHAWGTLSSSLGYTARYQNQSRHYFGYRDIKWFELVYGGYAWVSGVEALPTGPILVRCGIFIPGAPIPNVRVTWEGGRKNNDVLTGSLVDQGLIAPGVAEYISDRITPQMFGLTVFPANGLFFVRALHDIPQGVSSVNSVGREVVDAAEYTYYGRSDTMTDGTLLPPSSSITYVPSIAGVVGSGTGGGFGSVWSCMKPLAIIGEPVAPMISVLTGGDSIMQGPGIGTPGVSPNFKSGGYIANGLFDVNGHSIPWASVASYGSSVSGTAGYAATSNRMRALYKYATHVVWEHGSNDFNDPTTVSSLQKVWQDIRSAGRVQQLEQTMILRRTGTLWNISSLTSSGTTITATANAGNIANLSAGMYITIGGASLGTYNGNYQITSIPSSTTFTYVVGTAPASSPATGTITGSDSWATVGNQTIATQYDAVNAQIQALVGSSGLDAVLDTRAYFASPPAGWQGSNTVFPATGRANGGCDSLGVHPTDLLAQQVMAPAVKDRATQWLQAFVTQPPRLLSVPVIIGSRVQGQTLLCSKGVWGLGECAYQTLSYQWKSAGSNVGTNAPTYTLVAGDAGNAITCVVTATNVISSATATTAATGSIVAIASATPSTFPTSGALKSQASGLGDLQTSLTSTSGQADPLGGTTAYKAAFNGSGPQMLWATSPASLSDGAQYTFSVYLKAEEYSRIVAVISGSISVYSILFDASTGVPKNLRSLIDSTQTVPDLVGMIPMGNGWYRCYVTFTNYGGRNDNYTVRWYLSSSDVGPSPSALANGTGTTGSGVYLWRAEMVAGAIDT